MVTSRPSSRARNAYKWLYFAIPAAALAPQVLAQTVPKHVNVEGQHAERGPAPAYKRVATPIPIRVRDLLKRMTLEEKIAQLQSNSISPPLPGLAVGPAPAFGLVKGGKIDEAIAKRSLGNGIGAFSNNPLGLMGLSAVQQATQNNLIQDWVLKNTRLGIPVLFQGEALHGTVVNGATAFPQAIALGSTWDRNLIQRMFTVVGKQTRAAGVSMVLAPVFDLIRDPRYGRTEEMYSEDPYLTGELGVAAVQGLQGQGPGFDQSHVIAMAKHFVHGQPENGTNTAPSDFSERTMRSVFLPPFEKAVKVGKIGSIMPSYNENDGGVPSHANSWLLKDILRKEWAFEGVTNSDWYAVAQLYSKHHTASSLSDAGVQAFNAGLDLETPNGAGFATLADAVKTGKIKIADIDAAVSRILTLKFRAGLFEQPFTDTSRTNEVLADPANNELAREVAEKAIVLLKNEGKILPLNPDRIKTLAVIGPNADKVRLGGYSSAPSYGVSVLDGIRKRLGEKVSVSFAEGVRISEPDKAAVPNKFAPYGAPSAEKDAAAIAQAVETASKADVVVLVLGGNENITREAFGGAFSGFQPSLGDTDDLELPGRQNELVRAVAKLGKPIVAVLLNGQPYSAAELSKTVPAILEGWYVGQEGGNAVARVIFGDVNPSGKLAVTIARSAGQLPVFYYKTPQARLGYVFNPNTPLYPFGHGLSYTTFIYGKPTIDRTQIARDGIAKVTTEITNSGDRAGDEVVQLYVHPKTSSVVQPIIRLAGFERIHLEPGQTKSVSFQVGPEQLAIWDRQMKHVVEPGTSTIFVGPDVNHLTSIELEVTP